MAAPCPLPATHELSTLHAKLQGLLRFLREALAISNAHTVDFYTESLWEQLVDLPPERVLAVLRRSAAETEARPSEARPLVEGEREAGDWRRAGRAGRRRAGPAQRSVPPSVLVCFYNLKRTRNRVGRFLVIQHYFEGRQTVLSQCL